MKYKSVSEFFEHENKHLSYKNEIKEVITTVLSRSLALIREKAKKLKRFLMNDYSIMISKEIDSKNFIKKIILDQKKRNIRLNLRYKIEMHKEEEKNQKNLQEINKKKILKELEYKKYIESIIERSESRKISMSQSKSELYGIKKQKRLYQLMNDDFFNNYTKSEIENRNQILIERKKQYIPIRINELIHHSKRHSLYLQEKAKKKIHRRTKTSEKFPLSNCMKKIIQREFNQKISEENHEKLKKTSIDKRKKYSKIVKDCFPPKVDILKQKSLEKIKEK